MGPPLLSCTKGRQTSLVMMDILLTALAPLRSRSHAAMTDGSCQNWSVSVSFTYNCLHYFDCISSTLINFSAPIGTQGHYIFFLTDPLMILLQLMQCFNMSALLHFSLLIFLYTLTVYGMQKFQGSNITLFVNLHLRKSGMVVYWEFPVIYVLNYNDKIILSSKPCG